MFKYVNGKIKLVRFVVRYEVESMELNTPSLEEMERLKNSQNEEDIAAFSALLSQKKKVVSAYEKYCCSVEERDKIIASLKDKPYTIEEIEQSENAWLEELSFASFEEAERVYNNIDVLSVLKSEKIKELSEICQKTIYDGFIFDGVTYGYDAQDQQNLSDMAQAVSLNIAPEVITWKSKGESPFKEFSKENFKELYNAALTHKQSNIMRYYTKIAELAAASDRAEIEAVEF